MQKNSHTSSPRIYFLLFILLLSISTYAQASKLDHSTVTLTNNTNEKLSVTSTLLTTDTKFEKGTDWDACNVTLEPYETKQILWFNRSIHVKKDHQYQFKIDATHALFPGEALVFSLNQQGKQGVGSSITANFSVPKNGNTRLFNERRFEKHIESFWNNDYTIHARNWLPTGHLFTNFHFVIEKAENAIFSTPLKNQISVLSYNVQLLPFYAGVVDHLNHPDVRAHDIPEKIAHYDVLIVEELFDLRLRQIMKKALHPYYPYQTAVVKETKAIKFWSGGVMIFSKWPILKEDQIMYADGEGFDAMAAKGAIYAAINKQGKIYHLFGTHLQAGHEEKEKKARSKQLQALANFIDRHSIPIEEPILIGGDFNINQFSNELNLLLSSLNVNLLENIGHPYSSDGLTNSMKINKHRSRLDYVFYVQSHQIPIVALNKVFILRGLNNEKMWPNFDLSDHFPVASYFEFTNEG